MSLYGSNFLVEEVDKFLSRWNLSGLLTRAISTEDGIESSPDLDRTVMLSPPTNMRTLSVGTVDDVDVLVSLRLIDQQPTEFADTVVRGDESDGGVDGIHCPSTVLVFGAAI